MNDRSNRDPWDGANRDEGPEPKEVGPGLGLWLVPMIVAGGAVWITVLVYLLL